MVKRGARSDTVYHTQFDCRKFSDGRSWRCLCVVSIEVGPRPNAESDSAAIREAVRTPSLINLGDGRFIAAN